MGCTVSSSPAEIHNSKEIDKLLVGQQSQLRSEVKLLLLGTGESGKTTIIKQLRAIFDKEFSKEELANFRMVINQNIIQSMNTLAQTILKEGKQTPEIADQLQLMANRDMANSSDLNSDVARAVKHLWQNPVIQQRYENRSDLQIIDSAAVFFNDIDRISAHDYVPTQQDVMYARSRTTGINEICFKLTGRPLRLVDVGGQRSERRKWIHCFEGVTAIFFIVALSEYDQVLREDETTNRMQESMNLFSEITQIQFFQKTPILLFLNKSDLFKEKIKKVELKKFFTDFDGGADYDKAIKHIEKEFKGLPKNPDPDRKIYFHATCATDTENVRFVFKACQSVFMSQVINDIGF